jgi:oxygen-independent coproporphyrinogen-3 oxidase
MNVGWHALATRPVPRYTSYPTAPHFTSAIGPDTSAQWLSGGARESTLSLYLHVPYCEQLCHYCGCHTKMVRRRAPVEVYADRLMDEIATIGLLTRGRVVHIHFGGGTPSIVGPEGLQRISVALRESFDLSALREHAIELDPRGVTETLADALAATGVNRASLGVQEFSPHVQKAIGRVQPYEVVENAVRILRKAGIRRIAFDLMYGLPGQTARDVQRTAELAASLRPQRIALFGYAHVPWFKPNQRLIDEASLPSTKARLDQAELSQRALIALGYTPVGIDHFSLPDD